MDAAVRVGGEWQLVSPSLRESQASVEGEGFEGISHERNKIEALWGILKQDRHVTTGRPGCRYKTGGGLHPQKYRERSG